MLIEMFIKSFHLKENRNELINSCDNDNVLSPRKIILTCIQTDSKQQGNKSMFFLLRLFSVDFHR